VVRINAFVTDRAHMPAYMAARDRWLHGIERLPASTLVIVSGFTRPEFKVEVEVVVGFTAQAEAKINTRKLRKASKRFFILFS
jgi:enamine deaminase RidA (YjgF/YER057c/UK114 family)